MKRVLAVSCAGFGAVMFLSACAGGAVEALTNGLSCPEPNDPQVRHWVKDGACIETSYAPELERKLPEIQTALDAWQGVDCSSICFEPPRRVEEGDRPAELHFFVAPASSVPGSTFGVVRSSYQQNTGVILNVSVGVFEESLEAPELERALLRWVGLALGFEDSRDETSVLWPLANGVDRPSAGDLAGLCAKYAACR